jgi:2'-5' RNA ligase
MPFAVTLRLDDIAAAPIEAMWRALAESGVDDDCLRLGYPPHVTLAVWPEEAPVEPLAAAVERFGAAWDALPVALAGFGMFPGAPAVLWAAPVVTGALLARQAALVAAVPGTPCHPHHRPGRWVPHVTLGRTGAPGRALEALAPLWREVRPGRLDRLELVRFRPVSVLRGVPLGPGPRGRGAVETTWSPRGKFRNRYASECFCRP